MRYFYVPNFSATIIACCVALFIVQFAYHLIYRSYGAQILTINVLSTDMSSLPDFYEHLN
jgi:hypothetical protein